MEEGKLTVDIFLDLSKALDKINQSIPIRKYIGILCNIIILRFRNLSKLTIGYREFVLCGKSILI